MPTPITSAAEVSIVVIVAGEANVQEQAVPPIMQEAYSENFTRM